MIKKLLKEKKIRISNLARELDESPALLQYHIKKLDNGADYTLINIIKKIKEKTNLTYKQIIESEK